MSQCRKTWVSPITNLQASFWTLGLLSGDLMADLRLGFSNEIMRNIHTLSEVDSGFLLALGESLMSLVHTVEFVHKYWVNRGMFYGQRSDQGNLVRNVSSSEQSAGV